MKRILIVDDDPDLRRTLSALLESRGHQVWQAPTGRAGTELVGSQSPDLVVVDGLLPDTDGLTWIQRLRASGGRMPVLFASAFWKDKGAIALAAQLGDVALVQKPIVPAVLVDRIEEQLARLAAQKEEPPALSQDTSIEAALAELKREYGRVLPSRVEEVERAFEAVKANASAAREDLRMASHKIRGTAGSYGFVEISDTATLVEDIARQTLTRIGEPVSTEALALLQRHVERLRDLAREAAVGIADAPKLTPAEVSRPLDRVIVADDDPSFLTYVEELSRRYAVEIIRADTPDAVVEAGLCQPPDAAIIDVGLVGEDGGYDAARRLRGLPGCEHLPVAFISARDTVEARVAAAHAGGSLFLRKPLDATTLGDALQQLLSQRPSRPRVLLLDDDADFHAQVATVLSREGMQVLALQNANDLLAQMERFRPDLVMLDVMMPKITGFDVCRMLRTSPAWRDLPILFLTSQMSVETRVAAFRAGADDYLVKPVVPEELLARIAVRLERARLVQERAERDALTGILMRRPFMSRLSANLADAHRRELSVAIALIDIDHFKIVNDTHGHLAGDRVLSTFGRLVSTRFRATDLRARWGGEEFMLCFPGEPTTTTAAIVDRLLQEVRELTFESDVGQRFSVTFSAGIAAAPGDGTESQELIRTADRRLYIAKNSGRNRVVSEG